MAQVLLISKFQSLFYKNRGLVKQIDPVVFGEKLTLTTKLFGCRHYNLSRPFSQGVTNYRSCLDCGARKQFNSKTLETHGNFYFPPIIGKNEINSQS